MSIVIISVLLAGISCAPLVDKSKMELAINILNNYGYMKNNITNSDAFKNAITSYQNFTGLPNTGRLDESTLKMMNRPRCGMPDIIIQTPLEPTKVWKKRVLKYKISVYPKNMSELMIDEEIKKAMQLWSKYVQFDFVPRKRNADIEIIFAAGHHGDRAPFDGRGNVTAHAAPPYEGGAHFDGDEEWTLNSDNGINLYQTAAHEIGHTLGLHHSSHDGAIMAPIYQYSPNFTRALHEDDIGNIVRLYGAKPINKSTRLMDMCRGFMEFDTIFRTLHNHTVLLVDETYIEFDEHMEEIMHGDTNDRWPGLPHNVDAAFQSRYGKVYFFKGKQYWGYNGSQLLPGMPRMIFQGFRGIIGEVKAVLPLNESIYFFQDVNVTETGRHIHDPKGVHIRSKWRQIPTFVNAALNIDNNTIYFFRFTKYFVYNSLHNTTTEYKLGKWQGCDERRFVK